ncbi:MAG: reverse transcriptase family protein [Actinomycetota bacterium]|nr:reverse transcriptase family protein [Actinomycetota bacterium]
MYDAVDRSALANELADAFLTSPWKAEMVAESGAGCLDRWPSWMEALALSVVAVHRTPPVDRRGEMVSLIETFLAEHPPSASESEPPRVLRLLVDERVRTLAVPARGLLEHSWPIAEIESASALAEQLELSDGQLAWLADVRGLERTVADEKLRNYRYRTLARRAGLPRVIEAPKARLKEIQRWVLHEILDHVPAHEAAHGFISGRSAVSHARLHTRQDAVLRLDLKDFFASIAAGRVYGIFRTLGYTPSVAHILTGISTNAIPQVVWLGIPKTDESRLVQPQFWLGRQLATPHLPQGAPTSPSLANLAAFRLDRRLAGLAVASGFRYSRYADDLTFSGPPRLRRRRDHFEELAASIAREEGFALNHGKSVMRSSGARQSVCGVVVNVHPNVVRTEYDRLKAILHNAARHGPASQNRSGIADFEAHLRGRISWVSSVNPGRGEKLRRRFAEIDWGKSPGAADGDA